MDNKLLADVHGSCVSFSTIKRDTEYGKWESGYLKNNLFFSHVNHMGCMTKPPSVLPTNEDFCNITDHDRRNIISSLRKDTVRQLQESSAKYLILDFYDSARIQWFYSGGWYTHMAALEAVAPEYWKKLEPEITGIKKLCELPEGELSDKIHAYMDLMCDRYHEENIILNRTTMSRYFIDENHGIREIGEEQDYRGGWKDNGFIRYLEDMVLAEYQIACVDVSKFFVADWEFQHDVLSVHFEDGYYGCADRAYNKIINGKALVIDSLDEIAFAYKLDRDMTLPDGSDNWKNYIMAAERTFQVNPIMDELITTFNLDELCRYRHELAQCYRLIYDEADYFSNDNIPVAERQGRLVDLFERLTNC